MTPHTDAGALLKLADEMVVFFNFINEPPQYEDQRMVRDYRHELAQLWMPLHSKINAALAASQGNGRGEEAERCPTCHSLDGEYRYAPPIRQCLDPWHADAHLRKKALSRVPTGVSQDAMDWATAEIEKVQQFKAENPDWEGNTRPARDVIVPTGGEAELHRATVERCAATVLEQRCERGTPWDLACTTIARAIFGLIGEAHRSPVDAVALQAETATRSAVQSGDGWNAAQREAEILELRKLAAHWKERHDTVLQKHIECCGVAQASLTPELMNRTTVSCSGKEITIACNDHATKDALMDILVDTAYALPSADCGGGK